MTRKKSISLFLLSAAAGCIDAVGFLHSGIFPANMTGNSVMLALALTQANITGVASAGIALTGFVIGALVGARMVATDDDLHKWTPAVSRALCVTAGLLLLCGGAIAYFGLSSMPYVIIIAGAAMGVQSAAVLHVGVPGIATTVITGTLTTAITQVILKSRRQHSSGLTGAGPGLATGSWIAYFGGAIVGGSHGFVGLIVVELFPVVLLAIVIYLATRVGDNA